MAAKKKPAKKAPAKAGASTSTKEKKREEAAARKAAHAKLCAQYGEGYLALWDFLEQMGKIDDLESASVEDREILFEHINQIEDSILRYVTHECKTMDEAFRVRRPNGYRQPAARKRFEKRKGLLAYANCFKAAGVATDEAFFEILGEIAGVGKTKASEWYYEVEHRPLKPMDLPQSLEIYRHRLNWKK